MKSKEQEQLDRLLDAKASTAEQKTALAWLADYMEESYILNLPISKSVTQALVTFSKRRKVDTVLIERSKRLLKKYHSPG